MPERTYRVESAAAGPGCAGPAGRPQPTIEPLPVPTDEELVTRIAAADRAALADFYHRHAGRVLGLLGHLLGAHSEAEDVLQETFWQVWTHAAAYDSQRSSPVVWLAMLARSRARDRLRRAARLRPLDALPDVRLAVGSDEAVMRDEAVERARRALALLPEEQRIAICLAFYSGQTHEQIAAAEALPLGTVKTRIRRGMLRLRELLENESAVDREH